ncbi:MAG TPA: CpsD/CapB family tyrosine-protein kinase, partial [Vicinamibacterales bacterium]|nr:CpsD/CapB family tyrosine-protein kinase [Vicinamibacterales bacterium]
YVPEIGERVSAKRTDAHPRQIGGQSPAGSTAAPGAVVLRVPDHGKLVISPEMEPPIAEQYRRLAAVLHELQTNQNVKTLMVTSAMPREGKTLTVVNLALTLSESYRRRVLIVDGDMRHPSVHQALGIPNQVGLSDVLKAAADTPLPIVELTKTLSVLPAGRPDASPTSKLMAPRLQSILRDAAERFDWVIADTPPVGLLTDAQLVARLCDGVLFVIGAGSTPYDLVKKSIAEIGAERIVGTVLNRAETRTIRSDYYSHYYVRADEHHG